MAMEYATITGTVVIPGTTTGIPGELRATPRTTHGVLTFPAEDITTIGYARADVTSDGTLDPELQIPTDVPEGLLWRLTFHPKGKGNLPVHLGDYPIIESGDLADLVPIVGTVYGGFTDHGDITDDLEVTAGSHELDIAGDVEVTVVGTGDVTLHVHGTGTLTVAGTDFDLDGDAVILIITSPRGVQTAYLAGGGTGEPAIPDGTPPSAVTDLVATGGSEQLVLTWSAATDTESSVSYGYKVWLVGNTEPGTWTTRTTPGVTVTGLVAGDYNAKVYSFSSGGATTPDTATATVTAPAGPLDGLPLVGHWDASTLVGTAGTQIGTWADLDGGADMAQLTSSKRPTIQPATLNGMAVARFDTDDYMDSAARATSSHTLVLLRKAATSGTFVQMWHGAPDVSANYGGGAIIMGGNQGVFVHGIGIPTDGPAGIGAWERWIIRMGPGVTSLHVNGVQVVNDASTMGSVLSGGVARLGGSQSLDGSPQYGSGGMDLAEAMIFNAVLTTGEVADVDAYLVDKWGL